MPSTYQQHSWIEIRNRLKDRYEQKPFWTDQEALLAFNEGLYVWNLCTGRWRVRVRLSSKAAQPPQLYTLATQMVYNTRVEWNGIALSPSNREDLSFARYTWRQETTATGGDVPPRPLVWAPVSLQSFYLWPADANSGNVLTVDGVAATPVLVNDEDFLNLGEEHLDVLLGYALHQLAFTKGGQYFQATMPLFQAFLAAAAEENSQIKTSETFRKVMGLDQARELDRLRGQPNQLQNLGS